jgi:hypothetical protein
VDARLISFGLVEIDGRRFDRESWSTLATCAVGSRSHRKGYRDRYGHTPLSPDEKIPWSACGLIVGTGASRHLPIMPELSQESPRRGIEVPVGSDTRDTAVAGGRSADGWRVTNPAERNIIAAARVNDVAPVPAPG